MPTLKQIEERLHYLYSAKDVGRILPRLKKLLDKYKSDKIILAKKKKYHNKVCLTHADSVLITYGDSISKKGEKPLKTLHEFLKTRIKKSISGVHILPFFPSSSDDGFSVIDYKKVDAKLGSWEDVRKIGKDYRLMVDLVLNHISTKSKWFGGFLNGEEKYQDYFIHFDKKVNTSKVFRPRTSPLLTKFKTKKGDKFVWTTFSEDQVDLNYKNPEVLLEIIDVMLFYLSQGAEVLRIDAIAYIWKELGTSCLNLKKAHFVVKLFHDILKCVAPYAMILTETNLPHKENVSYFGHNGDEARLVYQFALPPIVLDAFAREKASNLNRFFRLLENLDTKNIFFNFLASHDGVGVLSAKDFLTKTERQNLAKTITNHGGFTSYKSLSGGNEVPYELNISFYDAINNPKAPTDEDVKRFIASQAILLSAKGIPGIYIQSLLGSRNNVKAAKKSGIKRSVNRQKLKFKKIEKELQDKKSLRHQVLKAYLKLLNTRKKICQFNPYRREKTVKSDQRLLVTEHNRGLMVIINVSGEKVKINKYLEKIDLIRRKQFNGKVLPYGIYYLV
ncbi:sugar phosphorylase [Candidatus Gracilibacteria bacterium]|nr:sugar phosphorylase [Candidatus Gracilibacteria bacterium]